MNFHKLSLQDNQYSRHRQLLAGLTGLGLMVALSSCSTVTTDQYEATAKTTLTWQVQYSLYSTRRDDTNTRFETFASTSLINRNGEKPQDAVIGPDEKGLWWPALPPKPSIDEVEQRQKLQEEPSKPEVLQTVDYQLTYNQSGETVTLPTNYQVYRQVAKAHSSGTPLQLTLGINNASVEKAEPVGK